MKKVLLSAALSLALASTAAYGADLKPMYKAPPPAPPAPPVWDIAFGAALMSDYNFRGISQSNRNPAVFAYFEPRYNINPNLQLYAGLSGYSIDFPNRASAEIDIYGGIRPTFGPLALDFGIWYYYYPGGQCFNSAVASCLPSLPVSGNIIKKDLSFVEFYGRATYTFSDYWAVSAAVFYASDWLNTGADGTFVSGGVKYTGAAFPNGIGWYVSGDVGRYFLGTTDAFYGLIPLPDYTAWNIGFGFTYKVFTLDFRYYDTDASKGECNALTSDQNATFNSGNIIPVINPGGFGSKWCSAAFVVALKADLLASKDLK